MNTHIFKILIISTFCTYPLMSQLSGEDSQENEKQIGDQGDQDGILLLEERLPLDYFGESPPVLVERFDTQDGSELEPRDFDFFGIEFGDSLSIVEDKVNKLDFLVPTPRNPVSLLPPSRDAVFTAYGNYFAREALFQFNAGFLEVINVAFDERIFSYFELYQTLENKYSRATRISPQLAIWELSGVRITLEKPLTIRYQDTRNEPTPPFVAPRVNKQDFLGQL